MTDEEKQAIESLIEIREFANLSNYKDTKINQLNAIDIILNLIEKQSKEIEKLKEIYQTGYVNGCVSKVYEINEKWKDRIEYTIEVVSDMVCVTSEQRQLQNFTLNVLQSLLEKE